MILQKAKLIAKRLEDPKHPLLGPNLKGLRFVGLWKPTSSMLNSLSYFYYFTCYLFGIAQCIEISELPDNLNQTLYNLSMFALNFMCIIKFSTYIYNRASWKQLAENISMKEVEQISRADEVSLKFMRNYTKHARVLTYSYWSLVILTLTVVISAPYLKYCFVESYREEIKNGTERLPEIITFWFPLDKTKIPVYAISSIWHILMVINGGTMLALYDSNAAVTMIFIKGQMRILKKNCNQLFKDAEIIPRQLLCQRIKEHHSHHNFLISQQTLLNSLLSPVMFLYVLICSTMICCSILQFSLEEIFVQKLWIIQYISALIFQLFLYCWLSNEVTVESIFLDRGIYESDWWKADVTIRRQFILLAGKLNRAFVMNAGPFTTLSVPTFISGIIFIWARIPAILKPTGLGRDDGIARDSTIMKGAYSFYTIFRQMQEK